jgi:hypothetical protein
MDPRSMWRQRGRWMKGGHLYVMAPNSIFFKRTPHMTLYQKSLYWIAPIAHFSQLLGEPVMFTLPFFCLVLKQCPYGMDIYLFWTHFLHVGASFVFSIYHWDSRNVRAALSGKSATRILWFTAFKACMNTIMVFTGYKKAGHFKFTPKAGVSAEEAAVSTVLNLGTCGPQSSNVMSEGTSRNGTSAQGSDASLIRRKKMEFSDVHDALSKVSETRKMCMPLDGTFDLWVLMLTTLLSTVALAVGVVRLVRRDALLDWENKNGLMWIGVVFALVDAAPGMLYLGCDAQPVWLCGRCAVPAAALRPAVILCTCSDIVHLLLYCAPAVILCTGRLQGLACGAVLQHCGRGSYAETGVAESVAASMFSSSHMHGRTRTGSQVQAHAGRLVAERTTVDAELSCQKLIPYLCYRYIASYDCYPRFLKVYCPMLVFIVASAVTLIEIRMAIGFTSGI